MTKLRSAPVLSVFLALLFCSAATNAKENTPVASVASVTTKDGQQGVAVSLGLSAMQISDAMPDEAHLEFLVAGLPADLTTSFSAYLVDRVPTGVVELASLPLVSFWEITPMDHANGLSNYVRLSLSTDILPSRSDGLCLIIISDHASLVGLLVGTSGGQLITTGTDREAVE